MVSLFDILNVLEIPSNVQRCCSRCYGNLIGEVCQRHNSQLLEEEDEDDEDDEENNEGSVVSDRSNTKTENGLIVQNEKFISFLINILFLL